MIGLTPTDWLALFGVFLGAFGSAVTVAWLVVQTWGETS